MRWSAPNSSQACVRALASLALAGVIGGVPLLHHAAGERNRRNFHCVQPGVLYRSGQMSPAGFARTLDEYGIGTVISLRSPRGKRDTNDDEFEAVQCRQRGVAFHRIQTRTLVEGSSADVGVDAFLELVADPACPKPVLIHCFAGVHRTGAYCAAFRIRCQGWPVEEAVAELIRVGGSRSVIPSELLDFVRAQHDKPAPTTRLPRFQRACSSNAQALTP